jgi:2,4-dienoyl-CoA reductase (NADPH2)
VHAADADVKICMQILHMGALAPNPACVAPSSVKSRIAPHTPQALDEAGIEKQLADFAHCAALARQAGYDGVEIIGSAGYLLSTFLVEKTNLRTDAMGRPVRAPHALPRGGGAPGCARPWGRISS